MKTIETIFLYFVVGLVCFIVTNTLVSRGIQNHVCEQVCYSKNMDFKERNSSKDDSCYCILDDSPETLIAVDYHKKPVK